MRSPPPIVRRITRRLPGFLLSLAVVAAATSGAGVRSSAAADDGSAKLRRYTVRGEIVSLPGTGGSRQLSLRHEAIDDFTDANGKVVGMGSMVMPFDVAPEVALQDLRPGDKVEARIAVGWSPSVLRIEQLQKLPPDTALEYRPARPRSGAHH